MPPSPPPRHSLLPLLFLPFLLTTTLLLLPSTCHAQTKTTTAALQLLRPTDETNRTSLEVVDSTLAYVEALEGPIAVVSILGIYIYIYVCVCVLLY